MIEIFLTPFIEFSFMRKALLGGLALSLAAGPIGVFLMLRRMSLIGDAIAHALLPGAALGFLIGGLSLGAMTLGGLVAGMGVALLSGAISRSTLIKEDMALAAFYILALALGVVLLSVNRTGLDVLGVLFGSILSLDDPTLVFLVSVATLVLGALAVLYRGFILECLDPGFAAGVHTHSAALHFALLALTVLTMVAGFHALGTLLVIGLMMLPAASARLLCDHITSMILVSIPIAFASTFFGLLLSFHAQWPSGPAIILVAGLFYGLALLVGPYGFGPKLFPRKHLEH